MFRALGFAVAAVSTIAVGTLLATAVLKIPAATWLALSKNAAPDCRPPTRSEMPLNVGTLVSVDIRDGDSGGALLSKDARDWADANTARVGSSTADDRDLVVYVHGFKTGAAEADCVGENLLVDLARLRQSQRQKGPDILVFIWPSEFGFFDFSQAQRNASRSAEYLSTLLGRMAGRKLYLVAHSLGSKVLMEALSGLPEPIAGKPVSGVLLVAGAIPATSVRNWSETITTRFPAAELGNRSLETQPLQQRREVTGEYVIAASRAEHLVVTIAAGDSVLGQLYSIDRLLTAGASTQPLMPPSPGAAPRTLPQNLAIGSPFPSSPIHGRFDHELKDPARQFDRFEHEDAVPRLRALDPSRILMSVEWTLDFRVPHSSYHELALTDIRWRPLLYWHAPLNDPTMRRAVLERAWALFDAPVKSAPPGKLAPIGGS